MGVITINDVYNNYELIKQNLILEVRFNVKSYTKSIIEEIGLDSTGNRKIKIDSIELFNTDNLVVNLIKKIESDKDMTLKEFFKEFSLEELADLYINRIQNDIARDEIKTIIMERLELPDEDSFQLWIRLF
jgi:hypothetical protein